MNTRRMFLAIWPSEAQVDQLYEVQSQYAGWGREVVPDVCRIRAISSEQGDEWPPFWIGTLSDGVSFFIN